MLVVSLDILWGTHNWIAYVQLPCQYPGRSSGGLGCQAPAQSAVLQSGIDPVNATSQRQEQATLSRDLETEMALPLR